MDVTKKVLGVRLPTGLIAAVKGEAVVRGLTMEAFVEGALRVALGERPRAAVPRAPAVEVAREKTLEDLLRSGAVKMGVQPVVKRGEECDGDQRRSEDDEEMF